MKSNLKLRYRFFIIVSFMSFMMFYAWVYGTAPFNEKINTLVVNGGTILAALIAALILTRIVFYFHKGEPPRLVWAAFAICIWLWLSAEAIWAFIYVTEGEVPAFTAADLLWLAGYMALTVSITRQYRLVFFDQKRAIQWAAFGVWVAILLVIETVLLFTKSDSLLEDFFRYFYLLADTVVGLSALYLVRVFRGRALAIPWLTVSSFVITDILYVRLTESGVYDYVMSGISMALLTDTLYMAAYLVVAWGVFEHYLLLRLSADHAQAEG